MQTKFQLSAKNRFGSLDELRNFLDSSEDITDQLELLEDAENDLALLCQIAKPTLHRTITDPTNLPKYRSTTRC